MAELDMKNFFWYIGPIAEIQINGDNQKIKLPKQLIRWNQNNEIVIKAGRNLMQTAYVDYDDIEFMNLSVQTF